jgi:putative RNA 2'-phosphotransferase
MIAFILPNRIAGKNLEGGQMSREETGRLATDEHVAVSRVLSRILRHEPEMVGIHLDAHGWMAIDELVCSINRRARAAQSPKRLRSLPTVTRALILDVVASSDKQRFSVSADGKRLSAAQGHSIDVDLGVRGHRAAAGPLPRHRMEQLAIHSKRRA